VASITGRVEVNLTVRDPVASAAWYAELLGLRTRYDYTSDDGHMRYVCLFDPSSSLVLCLVGHVENAGEPFSEFRTGLDHWAAEDHSCAARRRGYPPEGLAKCLVPERLTGIGRRR
jgi:catechol 2,3-dioxygenase-like lactoylglutathione lyase family enzyme